MRARSTSLAPSLLAALVAGGLAPACSAVEPSGAPVPERDAVSDAGAIAADTTTDARGVVSIAPRAARAHPPLAGPGTVADGVAHLNAYRALVGEAPVTIDEPSSRACAGHLAYLVWEQCARGGEPGITHDEPNRANPEYSAVHERAGLDADLSYGTTRGEGDSFGRAVDRWINALYHRKPLLDPGLVRVGAASDAGYACLNFRAPGNTVELRAPTPVLWPPDGATDVPTEFAGAELPCPTRPSDPHATNGHDCPKGGYIPSAVFYGSGRAGQSALESLATARMTAEPSGDEVKLTAVYAGGIAGHDPAEGYMADEIALVPESRLAEDTTYRVVIDATVRGAKVHLAWSFTTGQRAQ